VSGGVTGRRTTPARLARRAGHRAVVLLFTAFAVFPFYWMAITAFKQNSDLYVGATNTAHNPFLFNRPPTLDHLRILFGQTLFPTWLLNTFLVGAVVVGITLALAVPAGYSLARLTGRWGERLSIGIFLTYLVPSTLLFIPFSRLVSLLGLQDSRWSLVLIYPTFTVPFCTWLLMGFFRSLPREVEESAMVDGCSRVGAIWRMVLPLSVPGLLTVVIFALTLVIQEFVYSLTFISSVERMTVSVGVPVALIRGDVYYWGSLMAACLVTSVPIAVVYNLFLDRFIAGFTVGAVR
jgi:multiple sugar transport system permease protein